MIILIDILVTEGVKTIGMLFVQPLLYWSVILILVSGYQRIRRERLNFGYKIFDIDSEWKQTWVFSLVFGLILSIITLGVGVVFSYETIFLLSLVVILLSLTCKFSFLSASYTVGVTYLLLLLFPYILTYQSFFPETMFSQSNFTGLVLLLGILLFGEAFLLRRMKRNESFPSLMISDRGAWIGKHHLKKLSIIPFFTLIPNGMIQSVAPFWPYFDIGAQSYSVIIIPFIIGFDHIVRGTLPQQAAHQLSRSIALLAFLIILLACGSIFIPWLSLIAVVVAILGREYITYKHRVKDREQIPFFTPLDEGIKVLGIIPGTPADRLDILVGEIIVKVNGQTIRSVDDFYKALQQSGAFFKLGIIDDAGEIRFIQSAFYEGEHHKLGIIFTRDQYRNDKKALS